MIERIKGLFKDEEGATLVEYALMIALIAAVCVAVIVTIGQKANIAFGKIDAEMPAE
jgi:pilus assembly protein Flp/PilA